MEQCTNCKRTIGELEIPYVYSGQYIVCSECFGRLTDPKPTATLQPKSTSIKVVYEDKASPLPPKPKAPFFTLNSITYSPIKRVKLTLIDPDTEALASDVIEVQESMPPNILITAVEKKTGKKVTHFTILERGWTEEEERGLLGQYIDEFL